MNRTSLIAGTCVLAACGGGGSPSPTAVTDDTASLQAALDKGGTVQLEARTYHFSRTLTVSQSNTVIVGQGQAVTLLEFSPPEGQLTHCQTDRAITTPCEFDDPPPRQVGAAINLGDTSFQAAQASDVADLAPGDWLLINDYDQDIGDRVAVDWVQVAGIVGTTVNVVTPFRMAFTTARPWVPRKSGLGFEPIKPLVQGVKLQNLSIKVDPTTTTNVGALCMFGALDATIDNVTVTNTIGQPFYSYLSKGYTLTNSTAHGGAVISELAATVDLTVTGNTFSSDAPGVGVDLGTGFFTAANNTVQQSANAGMYFLYGVHDGKASGNQIAKVAVTTDMSSAGVLIWGSQNITVTDNNLMGGAGPASVGIDVRPYAAEITLPDTGVVLSGNTITGFVTAIQQQ